MMPRALRCRDNYLGPKGGMALAVGLTALTGLQTLDLGYGGVGAWCGVWTCCKDVAVRDAMYAAQEIWTLCSPAF